MKILAITVGVILIVSSSVFAQTPKPLSSADLAAYSNPDRERVLIEGAKREGKLVWYTTLAADQNKQLAGAFEAKYRGVKVETFRTGSSALAQRLLTEAKAKRHIADAIETTPPGLPRESAFASLHLAAPCRISGRG
jgi:ABC-type glycerol-3-phosphate transport system substrate-binding protein